MGGGAKQGKGLCDIDPLTNSFLLLEVLTSLQVLVKIDQELRPWECSQTDTDSPTDANQFYNLSYALCYSYGTDNKHMHTHIWYIVHCVQKKIPKYFLSYLLQNSDNSDKVWYTVFCINLKFAAKSCKRNPPHLKNISTLPCETWNAHRWRATIELLEKKTSEFISPQLWPPNSPDMNLVDYSMCGIVQEKVHKTRITDMEELIQRLRTDWTKLDHVVIVAPEWPSRPMVDISDCRHCTVSDFCCRCWQHKQLRVIYRPILAYYPFWRCNVVI